MIYHDNFINNMIIFYNAFYSLITLGDIPPSYNGTRAAICLLIIAVLTIVPSQLNHLSELLSMVAKFRQPFRATRDTEHIFLCGYVNDRMKLESFYRELFNVDRYITTGTDFFAIALSTTEPSGLIYFHQIYIY